MTTDKTYLTLEQSKSDPSLRDDITEMNCAVFHTFLKRNQEDKLNAPKKLEEAVSLTKAINLHPKIQHSFGLSQFLPATLLTKGIVEENKERFKEEEIELLIINHPLTPIQQRNLEKELNVKVIDRTGLILEIFGQRAQTKEGRLQVELAALTFQRSRLVRSWTHLERQRGSLGFVGGPGETQIELDRRMIDDRVAKIKTELTKVIKTRHENRKKRKSIPYPIIALVGYTNAGKSTLFNTLTDANVFAEDLLFATLDPTMRKHKLPSGREVIFSDTVGFISDLPTQLIAAFRATLEEVLEADIILHVRDIANEQTENQKKDVLKILKELGLSQKLLDQKIVEVLNKCDLLSEEEYNDVLRYARFKHDNLEEDLSPEKIIISAATGQYVDNLMHSIEDRLQSMFEKKTYLVPIHDGKAIAWIDSHMDVISRELENNNMLKFNVFTDSVMDNKLTKLFTIQDIST